MRTEEKIWLIEPGDVLEVKEPVRETSATARKPAVPAAATPRPRVSTAAPREVRPAAAAAPARSAMHLALLPLTYLAGPLALLLTPGGRRQRFWVGCGLATAAATVALLLIPFERFFGAAGLAAPLVWCALALLATAGTFTVWAKALLVAGFDLAPSLARLPRWLRHPATQILLGLAAPGAGLILAGRRFRAAAALWLLWPAALGALVLANGRGIWQALPRALPDPGLRPTVEMVFLAAAAAVVLGAVAWLVQALEPKRLLGPGRGRGHGDWYAVALGVACLALALTVDRADIARQLGDGADQLRADEMAVIPLALNLAADRLDPAEARYAAQASELCVALGRDDQAARLQQRLDRGLQTYLALVAPVATPSPHRPATAVPSSVVPAPADAAPPAVEAPRSPAAATELGLYYGFMGTPARDGRFDNDAPPRPAN